MFNFNIAFLVFRKTSNMLRRKMSKAEKRRVRQRALEILERHRSATEASDSESASQDSPENVPNQAEIEPTPIEPEPEPEPEANNLSIAMPDFDLSQESETSLPSPVSDFEIVKPVDLLPLDSPVEVCGQENCPCQWELDPNLDDPLESRVNKLMSQDMNPDLHGRPGRDPYDMDTLESYAETSYPGVQVSGSFDNFIVLENGLVLYPSPYRP